MTVFINKTTRSFYDYARAEWVLLDDTGSLTNPKVLGRFKRKREMWAYMENMHKTKI